MKISCFLKNDTTFIHFRDLDLPSYIAVDEKGDLCSYAIPITSNMTKLVLLDDKIYPSMQLQYLKYKKKGMVKNVQICFLLSGYEKASRMLLFQDPLNGVEL